MTLSPIKLLAWVIAPRQNGRLISLFGAVLFFVAPRLPGLSSHVSVTFWVSMLGLLIAVLGTVCHLRWMGNPKIHREELQKLIPSKPWER